MLSMQMIASRELTAKPAAVWSKVATEGAVVVTRDGLPMGIITPTSPETLLEDMQEIAFSRARRAVSRMRATATRHGTGGMTSNDIDAEIRRARKLRA
jgi:hypothetical protein